MSVTPHLSLHGVVYEVQNDMLIVSRKKEELLHLPVAPLIEGRQTHVANWSQTEDNHFTGRLNHGGVVHIAIDCGHICYWIETDTEQFETIAYFPGIKFNGRYWQTYMSDEHDRKWDKDIDQEVGLSSAYDDLQNPFGHDGAGMTDPGDFPSYLPWNMPARTFSVETDAEWIGFSMPGALPVGVVRLAMQNEKLSINFDVLRPSCEGGVMPRVYLVTGLKGAYDILDEHRLISEKLGLTVKREGNHPTWWTNPEFYYWDEFCRIEQEDPEAAKRKEIITQQNLLGWLNTAKTSIGIQDINMPMEQGCYEYYGDYKPTELMGGIEGFRQLVDQLRMEGTHVAFLPF